jgi:hypothetical protein
METKKCNKCFKEKTLACYSKNKANKDGKSNWCKDCYKTYQKGNTEQQALRKKNKKKDRDPILEDLIINEYEKNKYYSYLMSDNRGYV